MSHEPPRASASPQHPYALPAGTRLAEFELRSVIGVGGFGIVYRAFDPALEREVAIKEYMPAALAARGSGQPNVTPRCVNDADLFALGLHSFVKEARLLACFDHPSLVKVYRFWEQHGTAYMVMPLYRGRTLKQACDAGDGPADEATLLRVVLPVLGALEVLHAANVYHRDVTPDNILLGEDGVPVLLDFGAARRVVGDKTQPLTAILKPRFAPIEQYADAPNLPQGPWSDLYSLAAVMHFVITGVAPAAAAARAVDDQLAPLAWLDSVRFGAPLRRAIDWALALRPQQRPQDVATFRNVLEGRIEVPVERLSPPRPSPAREDQGVGAPAPPAGRDRSTEGVREPDPAPASHHVVAPPRRRWRWIAGAAVVATAGAMTWMQPAAESVRAPAPAAPQPAVAAAAESPAAAAPTATAIATTNGARKTTTADASRRIVTAPGGATSPGQACGERVFVALALCLQRECAKPRFREHMQCVRMRTEMAERRERIAQP